MSLNSIDESEIMNQVLRQTLTEAMAEMEKSV